MKWVDHGNSIKVAWNIRWYMMLTTKYGEPRTDITKTSKLILAQHQVCYHCWPQYISGNIYLLTYSKLIWLNLKIWDFSDSSVSTKTLKYRHNSIDAKTKKLFIGQESIVMLYYFTGKNKLLYKNNSVHQVSHKLEKFWCPQ